MAEAEPTPSSSEDKATWRSRLRAMERYRFTVTRPVAVLMGPLNLSSCEAFLLMMKQASRATLIGADSGGSSGNPQPHTTLAGMTVMLPSWQAMRPDGTVFEGEGIAPHAHVATTPEALATGDPVLAEALQRLRSAAGK